MLPFQLQQGRHIHQGTAHKGAVAFLQVGRVKFLFPDFEADPPAVFQQEGAGDAGQQPGTLRRSQDGIAGYQEKIGKGALAEFAVLVEENAFIQVPAPHQPERVPVLQVVEALDRQQRVGGITAPGHQAGFKPPLAPADEVALESPDLEQKGRG